MKLIRKENGDYHLLVNNEIKSLQEFNITKEDCDILTLGYNVEKMALNEYHVDSMQRLTQEGYYAIEKNVNGYITGFNAHKELVKDKFVLSKEQLEDALFNALNHSDSECCVTVLWSAMLSV